MPTNGLASLINIDAGEHKCIETDAKAGRQTHIRTNTPAWVSIFIMFE